MSFLMSSPIAYTDSWVDTIKIYNFTLNECRKRPKFQLHGFQHMEFPKFD